MPGLSSIQLKEQKERILSLWAERSLKEVPAASTVGMLSLRDSIPMYLDHLSEALASNRKMDFKSVFARDQEGIRIGKLHGADRASNRSYELTEVIFEYHILREVIFEVLETEGQLPAEQRDIIFDSIEQAVNDAAVEFSEVHADIRQKFISTLTHDLKTPITSAKMGAGLLLKFGNLPDALKITAKRIDGSLNRLTSMIHDLLDASRIRAGEQLSLQFVDGDLRSEMAEVVAEMMEVHGDRFIFESEKPLEGNWALDGLRRSVENIIGNAVKYGAADAPITVSLKRGTTGAELSVHNQGTPIPPNEIPLLFEQYRRAKSVEGGKQMGWGLGLTLVKGVMDAHKGKVRVESTKAKGTSFILEIPYAPKAPDL